MDLSKQQQYIIRNAGESEPKNKAFATKQEVIAEQYHIVRNWKPKSDVWPLTAGRSILISAAVVSSLYINQRFRARLKIRSYGSIPTMIGLTISPAAVTAILHTEFVMNRLLVLDIPCSLCMESESALAQVCGGVFLPLILAPIANFSITAGSGVYNVPHVSDPRGMFRTIMSAYQPLIPKIAMIFTFHALLAGFITYLEIKSFLRMLDLQYLMKEEKMQNKNNIE